MYRFAHDAKKRFPDKLVVFRQGDFYEALGYDAVMLVEHAGLNPMGGNDSKGGVPRAGFPVAAIHDRLRDLLHAGFSIAVGEEVPKQFQRTKSTANKERYIAAVVTPASPEYLNGLAASNNTSTADLLLSARPPPLMGITASARGWVGLLTDVSV